MNNFEEIKTAYGETLSSFVEIKKETFNHYGYLYSKSGQIDSNQREKIYLSPHTWSNQRIIPSSFGMYQRRKY
jgi:hypothetical protein